MKQVYVAREPARAHFLKGLLEAEGIPALVQGEDLFPLRFRVPMFHAYPSVWVVRDSDYERARQCVREFDRGEPPKTQEGGAWRCPGCGEALEPQFTECWKCRTSRREDTDSRSGG